MTFRTLDTVDVSGKRVLVRADLNVPVRDGEISDLTRIERLSPTIRELAGKGAKVIVCSHFDRPEGKSGPNLQVSGFPAVCLRSRRAGSQRPERPRASGKHRSHLRHDEPCADFSGQHRQSPKLSFPSSGRAFAMPADGLPF